MNCSQSVTPLVMPYRWMGRTLKGAARRGLRSEDLVRSAGIAAFHDGPLDDALLDPAEYMLMCGLLIAAVDDEMHDTTRSRMRVGTASLGVSVAASAQTLEGAINTLVRFFDVTGTYCLLGKERVGDDVLLTIKLDVERTELASLVEEMTATYLHAVLTYFLGFPLPVAAFHTTAKDHPNVGGAHPFLRGHVIPAGTTGLRIAAQHLALPRGRKILEGNFADCICSWVTSFCPTTERHLNMREAPTSAALFQLLMQGDADFDACCRALMMNGRDLRMALLQEGSNYRHIRRSALLERVRPFLSADAAMDDIAVSLGYSDARSLRRAVKLAGGGAIGEIRKQPQAENHDAKWTVFNNLRLHYSRLP
jgi:hypothetical protein